MFHCRNFSSWHSMCISLPFNVYLWLKFQKVVSHVLAEIVDTFGWSSVLLVYFNDGVTRLYLITSHSTHLVDFNQFVLFSPISANYWLKDVYYHWVLRNLGIFMLIIGTFTRFLCINFSKAKSYTFCMSINAISFPE